MNTWKKMFKARKKIEFTEDDMRTLKLREIEGGNRLTIDKGTERAELGSSLTEVEREWLFSVLAARYKVESHGPAARLS